MDRRKNEIVLVEMRRYRLGAGGLRRIEGQLAEKASPFGGQAQEFLLYPAAEISRLRRENDRLRTERAAPPIRV
jgi:hypothetical protein